VTDRLLHATGDLCALADELDRVRPAFPRRVEADPASVERGLAQLVLTLVELLRQLMERQALRRMDAGTLDDDEIERLGETFMKLEQRMEELKKSFGLGGKDLNLDLGPLGNVMWHDRLTSATVRPRRLALRQPELFEPRPQPS
jgi:hypothetical protein